MTDIPYQRALEVKKPLRDIVKPTVVLFLICTIVTFALAYTNAITADKIDEMIRLELNNARRKVLNVADSFEEIEELEEIISENADLGIVKEAYKGVKGQETVGNVFLVESKGYGGSITITVGIDNEGKITGVEIGDNNETPGLGAKAKDEPFISQFVGIIPEESLTVVKSNKSKSEEIDAISSATITSKAVTKAVQAAVDINAELMKRGGNS